MSDAQFGVAKILRPYTGFEAVYQGLSATIPIMFTEGGSSLDPEAGEPGYSPTLLRGLSVPYGSRISLWLPTVTGGSTSYQWQVTWRMRNVFDYRNRRIPYHFPKQVEGVPDTSVVSDQARVVLPAGHQILGVNVAPDPALVTQPVTVQLRAQFPQTASVIFNAPRISAGVSGQYQQGLLDPASFTFATLPLYDLYELQVQGDEMLIGAARTTSTWGFTAGQTDELFARLFGSTFGTFPDVGIYACAGAAS